MCECCGGVESQEEDIAGLRDEEAELRDQSGVVAAWAAGGE